MPNHFSLTELVTGELPNVFGSEVYLTFFFVSYLPHGIVYWR